MFPATVRAVAPVLLLLVALGLLRADDEKQKSADDLTADEKEVLELVNARRKKKDLPPLKANKLLVEMARKHSAKMVETGEFSHVIKGKGPADRAKAAGYKYSRIGENIAYGTALTPKGAMKMWMNSDGHRANILKKGYREIGVGIAEKGGDRYYTQVFGTALSEERPPERE